MIVGLVREELWTHVVRGPYKCAGHIILVFQHAGYTKVSNLDDVEPCQEDVLCFEVPVKNVSFMQILQKQRHSA